MDYSWETMLAVVERDDLDAFMAMLASVPADRVGQLAALSASFGATKVLDYWLRNGLNPDQKYFNNSLLRRAATAGQAEVVRILLAAGAKLDGVPLVAAASSGSLECVRLLVEAGADVDHGNPGFPTPLGAAEDKGHVEIARYLREHGATRRVGA